MYTEYSHYMLILSVLLALSARQPTFQMVWIVSLFCIVLNLSLFSLMTCYMCGDFSIYTILTNSNANTPLLFKLSATWSNHEGSLLLWCWLYSVFGLLLCYGVQPWTKGRVNGALRSHSHNREAEVGLPHPLICRGILIYVYLGLFLAVFLLSTSNPFLRIPFLCLNSVAELNPVLQDPILAIHPPCIYAGYVASAVGFSISLSRWANGLSLRNWSEMWVQIRVWSVISWCFFTVGILLGSWWAYHELGWGGWWFWDPVENASLMPWLIGTACIHSVLVPRNNGWTLFLNILIFVLSICGTFFVRSGLLASVHSFATDSTRGLFILCFVCLILAVSANYFVRFSLRSTLLFHSHRISPQYSLWTIPPTYIRQRMVNVPLPFCHSGTVAPGVLSVSADMLDYRFESPFSWLLMGYRSAISRRATRKRGAIGAKHFIFSRSASKSTSNDSLRASRTTDQKGRLRSATHCLARFARPFTQGWSEVVTPEGTIGKRRPFTQGWSEVSHFARPKGAKHCSAVRGLGSFHSPPHLKVLGSFHSPLVSPTGLALLDRTRPNRNRATSISRSDTTCITGTMGTSLLHSVAKQQTVERSYIFARYPSLRSATHCLTHFIRPFVIHFLHPSLRSMQDHSCAIGPIGSRIVFATTVHRSADLSYSDSLREFLDIPGYPHPSTSVLPEVPKTGYTTSQCTPLNRPSVNSVPSLTRGEIQYLGGAKSPLRGDRRSTISNEMRYRSVSRSDTRRPISLYLVSSQRDHRLGGPFSPNKISIYHAPISRNKTRIEQLLQLQNVLFCTICGVVMCGTVAPICFQALYNRDVSTGAPFFNGLLVPIFIGVLLVLIYAHSVQLRFGSLEPFAPLRGSDWVSRPFGRYGARPSKEGRVRSTTGQDQDTAALRRNNNSIPPRSTKGVVYFIAALCVLFLVLFIAVYAAVSVCEAVYALCVCVLFCSVFLSPERRMFIEGKLDCTYQSLPSRLVAFTRAFHPRSSFLARNMQIAHASVALFISGVLVSNNHKIQFTQIMRSGHEVQLGKLVCCLRGIDHNYGPTYRAICGNIVVYPQQSPIATLFDSGNQFCTESNEAGGKSDEVYIPISRSDMEYLGYAGVYPLDRVVRYPSLAGKGIYTGQTYGQSPGERSEMNIKRPYINGSCGLAKGCEKTNEWNHLQQTFCMFPEKRFCVSNEELSTTKVAIHTNFFSDCYANIGAGSAETGWFVTVMHLPYIVCIWLAFGLASIGGFLSLRTLLKTNKLNWH